MMVSMWVGVGGVRAWVGGGVDEGGEQVPPAAKGCATGLTPLRPLYISCIPRSRTYITDLSI